MNPSIDVTLRAFGLDVSHTGRALRSMGRYIRDGKEFRRLGGRWRLRDAYPVLADYDADAGVATGHYFHQDLWVARLIYKRRPPQHLDIGSRIDGFVSHLLTFMPVTVMDVRPLTSSVDGLSFIRGDGSDLTGYSDKSIDSLSCLHAIEHFGLGRYGDPVDPEAHVRAVREMARILAPNGRFYLSTPIGKERVHFNAHRVWDPVSVLEVCNLPLVSFAAVGDDGNLHVDVDPADYRNASYACGM